MTAISPTARNIKKLPGAIGRDGVLAAALSVGELVYIDSSGTISQADGSAAGTAYATGVITSIGTEGVTTGAIGDAAHVVVFGPVSGFTSLTPGDTLFVSDTAGDFDDAAGTVEVAIAFVWAADVVWMLGPKPTPAT